MTTKRFGGKITGLLALTMEADYAAEIGDWVELSDDYEVIKATGTKPILGKVSVANKKRISTTMGTSVGNPNVPGEITVESPGFFVSVETADETIVAGDEIAVIAGSKLVTKATAAVDEVYKITITATGGTYTITYAGQTTTALAYNASAATIETALEALSNIGTDEMLVTGTGANRTLTAAGTLGDLNLADITIDDALATGGTVTGEVVAQGSAGASLASTVVGIALTGAVQGGSFDMLAR